jgi:hypothetical protein
VCKKVEENEWSIVLAGFHGNWRDFQNAAPRLLDRHGLDVFTLVLGRDTMPAEILAGLSHDSALQIGDALIDVGARIQVVPTREVSDVRYHAEDVWATHTTDHFHFSEVEGMIFAAGPLNARRNINVLRQNPQMTAPWQYERAMNHIHADASMTELMPRERVREEVKLMELYEHNLRTLYPNQCFILSHILGHSISFYQFSSEAPANDIPPRFPGQEKVWCVVCHRQQPHCRRPEPDPEFPKADWGDCSVCGSEVLIDSWEVLHSIGPGNA